jgi:hypothetical protein
MIRIVCPNIETSKITKASPETLWQVLTDTTQWVIWGLSIRSVECTHKVIQKGSKGRIRTALGFWLPFEVTDFFPGRFWSWRVAGIRATGHGVEPLANGRCRLFFVVPLWAAPYVIVCQLAVRNIVCLAKMKQKPHMSTENQSSR